MIRAIHSELVKIRTTQVWWILLIGTFFAVALGFAYSALYGHFLLSSDLSEGDLPSNPLVAAASGVYTSGQFFGLLITMVMGILVVTNEFFHQTATTTFLATPSRFTVIGSKLVAAVIWGAVLWLFTFILALPAGMIFLSTEHQGLALGEPEVWRAIMLNALAFILWTIFGVGIGALLRSQIMAIVLTSILYLVGDTAINIAVQILKNVYHWNWVETVSVLIPSIASRLMVSGDPGGSLPPQWVGAVVLVGWGVLAGLLGTLMIKIRDIT